MKGMVNELHSENTDCSATYYVVSFAKHKLWFIAVDWSARTSTSLCITHMEVLNIHHYFIFIDKMADSSTIFWGLEPHWFRRLCSMWSMSLWQRFYKDHKDFVKEMFILCITETFVMRLSHIGPMKIQYYWWTKWLPIITCRVYCGKVFLLRKCCFVVLYFE